MDILDFCRSNSAQISEDIKDEYFPNGNFEIKKDAFFDKLTNNKQPLKFPFDSEFLFQRANYIKIVQILPEFLASIFSLGYDKVSSYIEYKDQIDKNNILVSTKNLRSVSEVLWESHKLLHTLILSGYTDHELKSKILSNLKLLNFRKTHYDIIGCFQTIHTAFALMLDIPGDSPTREVAIYIPKSHNKGDLLHRLVGNHSIPLRVLQQCKNTDSVDLNSLRIQIIEEYAKSNELTLPQGYEVNPLDETTSPDRVKEITPQYPGKVDGLELHPPEDQDPIEEMGTSFGGLAPNQIILKPKNRVGKKSQNQVIVGTSKYENVKNAEFDFLYLLAWLEAKGEPQLNSKTDITDYVSNHLLKDCSEKIKKSRFNTTWTKINDVNQKWEAVHQINSTLGFKLVDSEAEIFSLKDGYNIELRPYPLK